MGIFKRAKKAIEAKANAAVEKMSDPKKEMDLIIHELEEQRQVAIKELLSYKASAKTMEHDIVKFKESASKWDKRAMLAVTQGDDESAKSCLREKKEALKQIALITKDRDEAAGYAIELNASRKVFEQKLKMLKLRKGTLASQIASARGKGNFDASELMQKLADVEEQIDEDAAMVEARAEMNEDQLLAQSFDSLDVVDTDNDALAQLKAKMESAKLLKE